MQKENVQTLQKGFWFQLSNNDRQEVRDPWGPPWGPSNPQALNRYSYALNNPLRYTDPTGHCPVCVAAPAVPIGAVILFSLYGIGTIAFLVWWSDEANRASFNAMLETGMGNLDLFMTDLAIAVSADMTMAQASRHRQAKDAGGIPRSSKSIRQGRSRLGTKWWEYKDSNGKTKIVIEHTDGSVHVGTPKPHSPHGNPLGEPKYYPEPGTGHIGGP